MGWRENYSPNCNIPRETRISRGYEEETRLRISQTYTRADYLLHTEYVTHCV